MRPDDRAEARHELDLRLRAAREHDRLQLLDGLLGLGVGDRDAEPGSVRRRGLEAAPELLERFRPAADSGHGHDLAFFDRQDRLHVQQVAHQSPGAADPATLGEELERVDGEEDAAAFAVERGERLHFLVGRPARQQLLDRDRQHPDPDRRGLRVDEPDPVGPDVVGRQRGALERARQLRGDVQGVDALEAGECVVGGEEVLRRRLRGGRQLGGGAQPLVEPVRVELDVVAEALFAEADVQRHDAHVRIADLGVREVGCRVEHDGGVLEREVHWRNSPAERIAATISSSSWSLRRQATAPAAISASSSRGLAEAVRQTTATLGQSSASAIVVSTPSMPGSRKSITQTSGLNVRQAPTAADPSETAPTTSIPSCSSRSSSSAWRKTSLSSTSRTRIGWGTGKPPRRAP